MSKSKLASIIAGLGALALLIITLMVFSWTTIEGHERVVVQDWKSGVQEEILTAGTYFYAPMTTKHIKYNVGVGKLILGKQALYGDEKADFPALTVTVGGNGKEQPASFNVTLQYRLNPVKLINLHNSVRGDYEALLIKPALVRIISDASTKKEVLDFYSGQGRVDLQNEIEKAISDEDSLREVGIVVETFVIDDIELDKNYVEEIRGRQLATQKRLRAVEETKAAEEDARKAQAEGQAEKFRRIVKAEAEKEEKIRAAEARAKEVELNAAAKAKEVELASAADKVKVINAAEADRFRKEQDAAGVLALGMAQAKVEEEKKKSKYDGTAGARQAAVEIEQAKTDRFKNVAIKGVVTEKTMMMITDGDNLNKPSIMIDAK
jgi:regulator of protease activity HflC (stomatin/prohibitin superfamily)